MTMRRPGKVRTAVLGSVMALTLLGGTTTANAAPAGWKLYQKADCFEVLKKDKFYALTNVCKNFSNGTTRVADIRIGGVRYWICIGQHQMQSLGVRSEWSSLKQVTDHWLNSGCVLKSKPYVTAMPI
jgi:hypothetical protein